MRINVGSKAGSIRVAEDYLSHYDRNFVGAGSE
jgi:hypothetical protein